MYIYEKDEIVADIILWNPSHGIRVKYIPRKRTQINWLMISIADQTRYRTRWITDKSG